eukprot:12004746-Heterocapsa_arctica.AAC.1
MKDETNNIQIAEQIGEDISGNFTQNNKARTDDNTPKRTSLLEEIRKRKEVKEQEVSHMTKKCAITVRLPT